MKVLLRDLNSGDLDFVAHLGDFAYDFQVNVPIFPTQFNFSHSTFF